MQRLKRLGLLVALAVIAVTGTVLSRTGDAKPPSPPSPPLPSYSIELLGTLPGKTYSEAFGMNDWGDIVGESGEGNGSNARPWVSLVDGDGVRQPMFNLNDLLEGSEEYDANGDLTPGYWQLLGSASGINNFGQIVGTGRNSITDAGRVFRYTPADIAPNGVPIFEEIPLPAGVSHYNQAINDDGDVAGTFNNGGFHGYHVRDEGDGDFSFIDVGSLGSFTMGNATNDRFNGRAQICGTSGVNGGQRFAFRWTAPGETTPAVLLKLTTQVSTAYDINNSGHVVGEFFSANKWQAFRYTSSFQNLGNLGGTDTRAYAINDWGDVAGHARRKNGSTTIFLRTDALGMFDVEARIVDLPPNLQNRLTRGVTPYHVPLHINYAGQIAGTNEDRIAYVVTPLP